MVDSKEKYKFDLGVEGLIINISPESHIKITRKKGHDHQQKKLLIVKQILLVSTSRKV